MNSIMQSQKLINPESTIIYHKYAILQRRNGIPGHISSNRYEDH